MRFITKTLVVIIFSLASTTKVKAIEPFVVDDIKVEGLQRVELGTFFTSLPIRVGETLDDARVPTIIRTLYKTGNFDFVKLEKEANSLKIVVVERPIISNIFLSGNKVLKTEQLMEAMGGAGIEKGEVLDSFVLSRIEQEIINQYFSNGHYTLKVDKSLTERSRNRVDINIDIKEGGSAKIAEINIVGNNIFSEQELLQQFELTSGGFFSFIVDDNKYSSTILDKDIETLTSYYKDRGYLKFQVVSTLVSIDDKKEKVYITLNLDEGEQFTVDTVDIIGDIRIAPETLLSMVPLKQGDIYSAAAMAFAEERMKSVLGLFGYSYPEIRTIPELDESTNETQVKVFVQAGNRYYVDSIGFKGNETTDENVLRRELRIQEGGAMSSSLVESSKFRLQRLPFIEEVTVETPKKEGETDKVDVLFDITERSAAQISGGLGYNDFFGLQIQGELSHSNFLGSGNSASLSVNSNKAIKNIGLNYIDSYFTKTGIGLATRLTYSQTDYEELNLFAQSLDTLSLGSTLFFPISDFSSVSVGVDISKNSLSAPNERSQRVLDFFELLGSDARLDSDIDFDLVKFNLGYNYNTLNRSVFPSAGSSYGISLQTATSLGDVEYYKANFDYKTYFPIHQDGWIFSLRGSLGYGDGIGDTGSLPYFENFYAGGSGTLRGFENNVIGPRELRRFPTTAPAPTPLPGNVSPVITLPEEFDLISVGRFSVGGNARFLTSAELIFPTPFIEDSKSVRTSFFVDVGNVWDTNFDISRFENLAVAQGSVLSQVPDYSDYKNYKASYGISIQWLSAMGPLQFSLSRPIKSEPFDETETFTFNIGKTF